MVVSQPVCTEMRALRSAKGHGRDITDAIAAPAIGLFALLTIARAYKKMVGSTSRVSRYLRGSFW